MNRTRVEHPFEGLLNQVNEKVEFDSNIGWKTWPIFRLTIEGKSKKDHES
jgi:hypothetical protein